MALAISSGRKESKLEPQWRLAFAIRDASDSSSFLLIRTSAAFSGEELGNFRDSDLWELPCYELAEPKRNQELRDGSRHSELTCSVEAALLETGLKEFDIVEAVEKAQQLVPSPLHFSSLWKLISEPDFGPKRSSHTAVVIVETIHIASSAGIAEWFDSKRVVQLLVNEVPHADRIGVLAANLFYSSFPEGVCCDFKFDKAYQEYPPGILVMPMVSRTLKPFCKTNLVICAPPHSQIFEALGYDGDDAVLTGDALIVDPGCSVPAQEELAAIVKTLPKQLLVFITHHHLDHTEGLPVIARSRSEAMVIAHERTLQRMGSVHDGLKCIPVVGGTKIDIRGQRFEIIDAPGHTDGHLCLFHCDTRTLVAGDHCVGEGSSILDANSGGNLHDYLTTSHRMLELAPKVVVPMHGRPNLWPVQLLKGYIRHRQTREATILKAIEAGATSAFDIVSSAYKQTHVSLWPAALMNVKSHVEHLQKLEKLPLGFSIEKFRHSCGSAFMMRWFVKLATSKVSQIGLFSLAVSVSGVFFYLYRSRQNTRAVEE